MPGSSSHQRADSVNLSIRKDVYQSGPDGKAVKAISETDGVQAALDALTKPSTNGADTAQSGVDQAMASGSEPLRYSCDTCGVECTDVRYHTIRRSRSSDDSNGFDICQNCYSEGRFPSNLFSGDFVRLMHGSAYKRSVADGAAWKDQETLLLLEGLELFNDDWDRISEHVGTRTREECVSHFLQLPIEDQYLVSEGGVSSGSANGHPGPSQLLGRVDRLPFSQPDHPVLSVVAFLASVVDPEVAARAANDSIKELTDNLKRKADEAREPTDPTTGAASDPNLSNGEVNGMAVDTNNEVSTSKSSSELHRSAGIALASAAAKAHLLAQQTSTELTSQIHALVSMQVSKLTLKMQQFESLEAGLDAERRQIEMAKQMLQMERLGVEKQLDAVAGLSRRVGAGEQVAQSEVDRLRAMGMMTNGAEGSYRSGMPPRSIAVPGNIPPLVSAGAQFTQID